MARRSPGPWFVPWVCLVLVLHLGEGQKEKPFGEMCLEDFTAGLPDWVLDTDASVQNGATFLSSPMVHRSRDCMRACCKDPACNLALVEQGPRSEEDRIQGCFLLNCLYEKAFVCRFARKIGFLNFLKKDVYDSYLAMQNHRPSDDNPPIARAVKDMRVQPGEPVMLRGTESTDDHGIVSYEWKQILGDPSAEMKKHEEDQVEISNLQVGTYVFQLTVTDTAQQQDFTNITIVVLSSEQTEGDDACNNPICSACHCSLLGDIRVDEAWGATEVAKQENMKGFVDSWFCYEGALSLQEHCLTPKKVGWCRGSFPRWFYNPSLQQCEEFIFGGCKPNKNNYLREEECELACKNVRGSVGGRQQPVCNGNCQAPFFRCKDGCCIDAYLECDETPDCADESDEMYCEQYAREFNRLQKINVTHKQGHCVDLPDTGQCTESISRWYYNPFLEKCDPFTYGGCGGNSNNFEQEEECMKSCSGITKADVIGRRWESFESQTAMLSAFEVVIAVLLGICIMVVLVFIGYFFLKKRKKSSHRRQPPTATNSTLSTTEDTEHLFYSSGIKPV